MNPDEQRSSVFSVIFCSINPPVKRSPRTGVLNRRERSKQRKRARELVRLIYELIFHWYWEDLARHVVGRLEDLNPDERRSSVFSVIFCSINPPVLRQRHLGGRPGRLVPVPFCRLSFIPIPACPPTLTPPIRRSPMPRVTVHKDSQAITPLPTPSPNSSNPSPGSRTPNSTSRRPPRNPMPRRPSHRSRPLRRSSRSSARSRPS